MDIRQATALPVLWQRWTEFVAGIAGDKKRRVRIDPTEYEALHRALLAACQAMITRAQADAHTWLRHLQQVVEPWMTASSLEQIDNELLQDILVRCRAVDREIGGHGWGATLLRRQRWHIALVVSCLVAPPLVVAITYWGELSPSDSFQTGWRSTRRLVQATGDGGFWFLATCAAVLGFTVWTLWALAGPRR